MSSKTGLILTMGLSPDPLIFAIKRYAPEFVVFIGTSESFDKSLDTIIEETKLKPSKYHKIEISDDANKIGTLVSFFQDGYRKLLEKSIDKDNIIADPTGGRKWMSSGATIAASFLGIQMIYIDATYINGILQEDSMKIVKLGNAYDQTGFIAAEQGQNAFNNASFQLASNYFSLIRPTDSVKNEFFKGLAQLAGALEKWDRFEHYSSKISNEFDSAIDNIERAMKSSSTSKEINLFLQEIKNFVKGIKEIEEKAKATPGFIVDLLLNAKRRAQVFRFDDAVARLYRTVEVVAQFILDREYGFNPGKPDFSLFDESIKQSYENQGYNIKDKLGLKQSFELLYFAGNEEALKLIRPGKKGKLNFIMESILNERNDSILAHGFKPINNANVDKFITQTEDLVKSVLADEYEKWNRTLKVPTLPDLKN